MDMTQLRAPFGRLAGRRWQCALLACCGLLSLVPCDRAAGQIPDAEPGRIHYFGIEELYSGDLRSARRIFRRAFNSAIRVGTTRWVDSICYHAMQGEVYYQLGNLADALAHYDQACQLYLQNPDWIQRVKFQSPPRADVNLTRRGPPPWGTSERQATLGKLPNTMLVFFGRFQSARELSQPGLNTVEVPQYFKLGVPEVVRCTALAIRRRNEILGPIGQYDRISKDLVATLSRGGLAAPNHWSNAWIELQLALAQIGVGDPQQAQTHLSRALLLNGRFDHPLTCVVLLEQGKLALKAGNGPLAARLLAEASISAYYYDNWNVIDESLRLGQQNHIVMAAQGVYPPLAPAAEWTRRKGLRLISTNMHIARAENLASLGETRAAASALDDASRTLGRMSEARPGTRHLYVQAVVGFQQRRGDAAQQALSQAIARQMKSSPRRFQLARTNVLFDGTEGVRISSRVAVDLYESLLADPTPDDWAQRPLDTFAMMASPAADAFDRWLIASLGRDELLTAVQICDQAKRRRFHAALPWGGRLLALRTLLEAPAVDIAQDAVLDRQRILGDYPAYDRLSTASAELERSLADLPVLAEDQQQHKQLFDLYKHWYQNVGEREDLLQLIGTSRQPATMLFPPLRTGEQLQQSLPEGKLVVMFHAAAGRLHGFLITHDAYHHWELGSARELQQGIAGLLRELGNHGPGRTLSSEDLVDGGWRSSAHRVFQQVFADSRIEPGQVSELIVIPDHMLWYLPFEVLIPDAGDEQQTLTEMTLIRYAPTAALGIGDQRPFQRVRQTALVANDLDGDARADFLEPSLERLADVVEGAVRLPVPLPVPAPLVAGRLEQLVSFDDIVMDATAPYAWSPLPRDRGRTGGIGALMGLPWSGPERVILAGFSTAAESGLKDNSRRGGNAAQPGDELFHTACGLMASGARTALLSRWRTGGQANMELVREFVQELPHVPAADAWQRAMLVARDEPLDVGREPRLKSSSDTAIETPTADHPFFWAGYMLLDTGGDPADLEEEDPADEPDPVAQLEQADQEPSE